MPEVTSSRNHGARAPLTTYVITAVAVSLFLGYGVSIVSSIGGVTVTIDMVEAAPTAIQIEAAAL